MYGMRRQVTTSWLSSVVVILIMLAGGRIHAQQTAFSSIELRASVLDNLSNDDAFFLHWHAGKGVGLSGKTPFYAGNAELGLYYNAYDAIGNDIPSMKALHMFVGWGYPLQVKSFTIEPAFRLGNYRMIFNDGSTEFRSEMDESEFSTSIVLSGKLNLNRSLGIFGEVSRTTVYTYYRLYYNYIGAGVSLRFNTGSAFQGALSQ